MTPVWWPVVPAGAGGSRLVGVSEPKAGFAVPDPRQSGRAFLARTSPRLALVELADGQLAARTS